MKEKNKSIFTIKNFIYVILLGLIISIFILKPFSQAHLYNNEPNNNYYSTVNYFLYTENFFLFSDIKKLENIKLDKNTKLILNKQLGKVKIILVDSKGREALISKSTKSFNKDTYTLIITGVCFVGNLQITK